MNQGTTGSDFFASLNPQEVKSCVNNHTDFSVARAPDPTPSSTSATSTPTFNVITGHDINDIVGQFDSEDKAFKHAFDLSIKTAQFQCEIDRIENSWRPEPTPNAPQPTH